MRYCAEQPTVIRYAVDVNCERGSSLMQMKWQKVLYPHKYLCPDGQTIYQNMKDMPLPKRVVLWHPDKGGSVWEIALPHVEFELPEVETKSPPSARTHPAGR